MHPSIAALVLLLRAASYISTFSVLYSDSVPLQYKKKKCKKKLTLSWERRMHGCLHKKKKNFGNAVDWLTDPPLKRKERRIPKLQYRSNFYWWCSCWGKLIKLLLLLYLILRSIYRMMLVQASSLGEQRPPWIMLLLVLPEYCCAVVIMMLPVQSIYFTGHVWAMAVTVGHDCK